MVDLDPNQLYARGLSPQDVQSAINSQNLIVPSGTAKIGDTEYYVKLNSSPQLIADFNNMPVKSVNGVPIYVKDVANVHMGYAVQTNVVRRDGRRAVLMTILKGEGASSLDVVRARPRGPARHPGADAAGAEDGACSSTSRSSSARRSTASSRRGRSRPG